MKKSKIYYLLVLIFSVSTVFVACDKDDDDDEPSPLFSKTISVKGSAPGITLDFTWVVNDTIPDGHNYTDIDFFADDTTQGGAGNYEFNSSNGTGTESFDIDTTDTDGTYFICGYYYDDEPAGSGLAAKNSVYTAEIYPQGDNSNPTKVKATIEERTTGTLSYAKYKIVKTGSTFKIQQLPSTISIDNGY